MTVDEVQPLVGMKSPPPPGSADALLRLLRLSQAEKADISLFIAPARLQVARRLLGSGLFAGVRSPEPAFSNDN